MYVCVYMCTYVCIIYMYASMQVCINASMYVFTMPFHATGILYMQFMTLLKGQWDIYVP